MIRVNYSTPKAGSARAQSKQSEPKDVEPKEFFQARGSSGGWEPPGRVAPPGAEHKVIEAASPPEPGVAAQADAPDSHGDWGGKVAAGVGLALAGFGALAGLASPAQAAEVQMVANVDTTPVHATSIQDVVNRWTANRPLYVIGNPQYQGKPLSAQDMQVFQDAVRKHPNFTIVLVEETRDHLGDERILGPGIGNNQEYLNLRNPATGEHQGAIIMIAFKANTSQGRSIFMRTEPGSLPDKLGVGDDQFFPGGNPGSLGRIFVDGVKNEGLSPGAAIEKVMERVDNTIAQHVAQRVGSAESALTAAESAVDGVKPAVREFQREFGQGGKLGSPDIPGWEAKLRQGREAFAQHDFERATSLAGEVVSSVRTQEQAMAAYRTAPDTARGLQSTLEQVNGDIATLADNSQAQSARNHHGQATSALAAYRQAYEAKDPSFVDHLKSAESHTSQAAGDVKTSRDATELGKKVKLYGTAAVVVAVMATGAVMNHKARKSKGNAKRELDEAVNEISERTQELVALMNKADYHTVAGYTGKTKKLADELVENTANALTLVGGCEKFLAEAETLIDGKGLGGKLQNMFLSGNFDKAVALLTDPEARLQFDTGDSARAVMEENSRASTWRQEILSTGKTRQFEKSLKEVLLAMADSRDTAESIIREIDHKNSEIDQYLNGIETDAQAASQKAADLEEKGKPDGLFTAPSVNSNLLASVLGSADEGGLIAKGRELKVSDPVRAWDDYGTVAKRMTGDADAIVALGNHGRDDLLPTLAKGDEALHPHEVKTDWAHQAKEKLSDQLDLTANTAMRKGVGDDVSGIRKEVDRLGARVNTVVEQDTQRREVSPVQISQAELDVAQARTDIHHLLQEVGAFKQGTPDQVLREPDRDPTDRTTDAHQHLDAIKPRLDVGDIETAGQHLVDIHDLTQDAHRLVSETRLALAEYPDTLFERQQRHVSITDSIPATYQPSFDRIKATYEDKVMGQVAADVGAGDTLADNIKEANEKLDNAHNLTEGARDNHDKAYLLTARDLLNDTDNVLKGAQTNLDSVTKAEALLAEKQQKAEAELGQLEGRVSGTQARSNEHYVRDQAKRLVNETVSHLGGAREAVNRSPKSPYDAESSLSKTEGSRQSAESAIEADHQAYQEAQSAIAGASAAILAAHAAISRAASWSDSDYVSGHGTVSTSVSSSDLSGARSSLATAEALMVTAGIEMGQKEFEDAESHANSAATAAVMATSEAESAISRARSRHSSDVSSARAEVQRREDEERRRRESSSSSGGSSGGWSGGGSSGGSSGGW
ncbi:MAG: hypothetical protein AB7S38_34660 [Vulcanimicrobiota bacterium]